MPAPIVDFFEGARRLGRPAQFGEFVEYNEISKNLLDALADADEFEVEHRAADGSWEPISFWRLDATRAPVVPADSADPVSAMRRISAKCSRKPGLGETVHHIMDHLGLPRDRVASILRKLGYDDLYTSKIAAKRQEGIKREKQGRSCRFCT